MNEDAFATITIIGIVTVIICGSAGGVYVANETGYLPWINHPYVPANIDTTKSDSACNHLFESVESELLTFKDTIKDYKMFKSESRPEEIVQLYKDKYLSQGYTVEKEGIAEVTFENKIYQIHYCAATEGLTIVGVAAIIPCKSCEGCCVLTALGSVFEVKQALDQQGYDYGYGMD